MALFSSMRQNTKIIMWVVIVAFVGFIILSWGMQMSGKRTGNQPPHGGYIAKINGTSVPFALYSRTLDEMFRAYRIQNPQQEITDQVAQSLHEEAWNRMVLRVILDQEVAKRGIVVSDDELLFDLRMNPPSEFYQSEAFRDEEGNFDFEKYHAALFNPTYDWSELEARRRESLPIQMLQFRVGESARVSDSEAWQIYRQQNEKVDVDHVAFTWYEFSDVEVEISDSEIASYYESHKDEFFEIEYSNLTYVMVSKEPTEADDEETRLRAGDLLADIREGADFAEMARLHSDDPQNAEKGGDLGFFTKTDMVPEFSEVAFSLEAGEVGGPVKTQFGYHLIKVEEKKEGGEEESIQARHILLRVQPSQQTLDRARDLTVELNEVANAVGLEAAAESLGLEVKETGLFPRSVRQLPGIGYLRQADRLAFETPIGKLLPLTESSAGYFLIVVKERTEAGTKPLSEIEEDVRRRVENRKRIDLAREKAETLISKVRDGASLEDAAKELGKEKRNTGAFGRFDAIPGVGREHAFAAAAFVLEPGRISNPVELTSGWAVLRVLEKTPADREAYEDERETYVSQLSRQKKQLAVQEWLEGLVRTSAIEDYRIDWGL